VEKIMSKNQNQKMVGFRVSSETHAELSAISTEEQMLLSSVIRALLRIGIDEYRKAKSRASTGSNLLQLLDRE
jgi:hypothetical protein